MEVHALPLLHLGNAFSKPGASPFQVDIRGEGQRAFLDSRRGDDAVKIIQVDHRDWPEDEPGSGQLESIHIDEHRVGHVVQSRDRDAGPS